MGLHGWGRSTPRLLVAATLALVLGAVPAGALTRQREGVTSATVSLSISPSPDPIHIGQQLRVAGRLRAPHVARQVVNLYVRLPLRSGYSWIKTTRTDAYGRYTFAFASGTVTTNRSYYVAAPHFGVHSRVIEEWVRSLVTIQASAARGLTFHRLRFLGTVAPGTSRVGEHLVLQQNSALAGWFTIGSCVLTAAYSCTAPGAFDVPGRFHVRYWLAADKMNAASSSSSATVTVTQAENGSFTITAAAPVVVAGVGTTIFGGLYKPGTTNQPDPHVGVALWARGATGPFAEIASTTTGSNGAFVFHVSPRHNEIYQAQTTTGSVQTTAQLFEGVRASLTLLPALKTVRVGRSVILAGAMTPTETGGTVDLQSKSAGTYWTLSSVVLAAGPRYTFTVTPTKGVHSYRVFFPGANDLFSGASPSVIVTVL